jgi:hypothetical protein
LNPQPFPALTAFPPFHRSKVVQRYQFFLL